MSSGLDIVSPELTCLSIDVLVFIEMLALF